MQRKPIVSALAIVLLTIFSMGSRALGANQNVQRTDVTLTPSLFSPTNAIGDATLTQRRYRADFEVDVEGLLPGVYDVFVGGQNRVQLLVTGAQGGSQGKIELSTRPLAGQLALQFDPRGQSIEVRLGSTVYFSGTLKAPGNPEGPDDSAMFNIVSDKVNLANHDARRAKGKATVKSNKGLATLMFQLQRLDPGQYSITANDIEIATFIPSKKGAAKVRFRTAPKKNDLMLDFDPASTTYRILRGDTLVLDGTSAARPIGGGTSPIGALKRSFNNTGAYPGATGEAIFRDRSNSFEFEVGVRGLPIGVYDLIVDGTNEGSIGVVSDAQDGTKGTIEYSTEPNPPGVLSLDFDPRGQTVQVVQGEAIVLSMSFPN